MNHTSKVPFSFSWEDKPGVSKHDDEQVSQKLLPPPPCPAKTLPPGAFQPPWGSSSRKGVVMNTKHDQDPFWVAFKECTKTSSGKGTEQLLARNKQHSNRGGLFSFSCKQQHSCSVRVDNLVRVSELPAYRNHKDGDL